MANLESHRLPELPESGYYIPNFISAEQEAYILEEVSKLPEGRWKVLTHRRLLSLPSQLTGTARDTLIDAPLPRFLATPVLDQLKALEVFVGSPHGGPNHCLVNEYQPAQGIMPHEDGPAYHPITATVSLGSHTVLDVYRKNEQGEREAAPSWRILQEPRSLLVTTGDMYGGTLHGIAELGEDQDLGSETIVNWALLADKGAYKSGAAKRATRLSLTYRDVLKVAKLGGAMKFMNKQR